MHSASGSTQDLVTVSTRKARFKRRTPLEFRLILVAAALGVVGLALLVSLAVVASLYTQGLEAWNREECRSEQCIYSAAMLLQGLDRSADPCVDFFQYACGRWPQAHPVPDNHIYNSWFLERQEALQRRVTEVLQANSSDSDPKPVKMAHRFYKSCTNTDQLEKLGLQPMLDLLGNLSLPLGLPNKATVQDFQLAKTLASAQRFISKDILLEIGLEKDDKDPNNSKMVLHLMPSQNSHPLPELLVGEDPERPTAAPLTSKELLLLKISYMSRIIALVDLAAHPDEPDYEVNATEVSGAALRILIADTQLNTATTKDGDPAGSKPLRTTFAELQEILANASQAQSPLATEPDAEVLTTASPPSPEAPAEAGLKLDFAQYLEVLLEGINATVDINSDPVFVSDLPYFKTLAAMLAHSKPETIQRLVWWKVVETVAVHTNQIMRDMRHQLMSSFYRGLQPTSRSKFCVRAVKRFLHMALSYKMAVKNPLDDTTTRVREMLSDISSAFGDLVRAVPWMDSETKAATLEKAKGISAFIGYPEWLLKPGELETYYEGIELSEDAFLWNMLHMKAREVKRLLGALATGPVPEDSRDRWTTDPIEVNAYYSRSINSIGKQALNYGAIGSILGHELTHGFDIEGKEHDKKGLRNPWWRKEVTEEYNQRAQCFVRQYDRYAVQPSVTVNGSHTLAENIADNGGVREALLAYRGYTRRTGPEPALPGLNDFSHEQLFFLAFANVWCQNADSQFDVLQLRDSHSPARFRVVGALSNSPDFARVWGCSANSPMNPQDKCIIW